MAGFQRAASNKMNKDQGKLRRLPGARSASPDVKRQKAGATITAPRGRPRKDAAHREADQQALIAAASDIVREAGPAALTARTVAARVGTAVGSVYTAFPNLESLRLEVNAVTMGLLRDALADALMRSVERSLKERLLNLSGAYIAFADAHPTLWAALFEPRTLPAPPAMAAQIADLFSLLEDMLRRAGCAAPGIPILSRAIWAAVHGTVFLAGHGSLGPVGRDDVAVLVDTLVRAIVGGLTAQRHEGETA